MIEDNFGKEKTLKKELLYYLIIIVVTFVFFTFFVPRMIKESKNMNDINLETINMIKNNCIEREGIFIEGGFAERPMCIINYTKYEYFLIEEDDKIKLIMIRP